MFYDLNIPWAANDPELPRTIAFLVELGYDTIALTVTLTGKLPATHTCPIPANPFPQYPKLKILRRCLLLLSDPSQLQSRHNLHAQYDLVTIRPLSEKLLQQTCGSIECDLISLDLSARMSYPLKHKTLGTAKARGIKFEICYAGATGAGATESRRNVIAGAAAMIRALRGAKTGGVVISSGARRAAELRAPFDVVNLSTIWGLRQEVGRDAVGNTAREVVRAAEARRKAWRGIVESVDVGGYEDSGEGAASKEEEGKKRKAEEPVAPDEGKTSKKARKKKKSGLMLQEGAEI